MAAESTYISSDEINCHGGSELPCYDQYYCQILRKLYNDSSLNCVEHKKKYYSNHISYNGYSRYKLHADKVDTVIISIHGLWGDSRQFYKMLNENTSVSHELNFNSIELTLPGHIKTYYEEISVYAQNINKEPPFAPYQEWIDALEETLLLTNKLADNVIVVG